MLCIRHIVTAAAVGLACWATPALVLGQNSELPLQPGQVQQEQVAKLVAVLQSDAALFDKAKACQRLAVIGTRDAVPALAALLSDEQLAHYARYGLEPIPDSAVDEALRDAMGKLKGKLLIGVINSIGNRRDAGATEGLRRLLADPDPDVAAAAAAALGRVGNPRAADILQNALTGAPAALRSSVGDACLACAEGLFDQGKREEAAALYDAMRGADLPKHLHIAARRGAILARQSAGIPLLVEQLNADDAAMFGVALRVARELAGGDVTQALLSQLADLTPQRKALLLLTLGDRGDAAALAAVLEAAEAGPAETRVAAIQSLRQLGDASAVPVLLEAAVQGEAEVAEAAQAALVALRGNDVDEAIAARLDEGHGKTRQAVVDVAGQRRIASAVPALFKAADSPEQEIRLAAIKALGTTIRLDNLSELTDRLLAAKTPEQQAALQEALEAASIRMPDREACAAKLVAGMSRAPVEVKVFLLELLGSVGGRRALEAVSAGAKDANADIQDAATRVLGEWLSPDAAPVLLALAKSSIDDKFRIRALRGYIRIARQLGLPTEERLAMCREAMELAWRDAEKKLVLEVLGRNPSAESLSLAVPHLDSAALKEAASAAAVAIAEKILDSHPAQVAEAMPKVLQATADGELTGRAKRLLNRAKRKLGQK